MSEAFCIIDLAQVYIPATSSQWISIPSVEVTARTVCSSEHAVPGHYYGYSSPSHCHGAWIICHSTVIHPLARMMGGHNGATLFLYSQPGSSSCCCKSTLHPAASAATNASNGTCLSNTQASCSIFPSNRDDSGTVRYITLLQLPVVSTQHYPKSSAFMPAILQSLLGLLSGLHPVPFGRGPSGELLSELG